MRDGFCVLFFIHSGTSMQQKKKKRSNFVEMLPKKGPAQLACCVFRRSGFFVFINFGAFFFCFSQELKQNPFSRIEVGYANRGGRTSQRKGKPCVFAQPTN